MAQIIYHIRNTQKKEQILALCRRLGLSAAECTAADTEKTVAQLAGLPGASGAELAQKKSFFVLPDLLLFCGLNRMQLDGFLNAYRAARIEKTPLKAMVTPSNQYWSIRKLAEELERENRTFTNRP